MANPDKVKLAKLKAEQVRREAAKILPNLYAMLYGWQLRFIEATADNDACALMASNQCGKSMTGCAVDAYHLLGDYPEDWPGHKFEKPPLCWLLGYSGTKTRDLLQHKLFGRVQDGKLTGGYVPADRIVDYKAMSSVSGACSEVRVRHKKGISTCQFWSYSQGQHALMGDVVDWYHIDEEPEDPEIWPQVVTRTINGDKGKGGRGILTFTPENGKTQLVCQFMEEPQPGMYLQGATWGECPHITKDKAELILAKYPAWQRDMRSKGVPLMGHGLIFEHPFEQISCKRFEIPDFWWVINGMDFGWDHPQAHVQLVIDPETETIYVTQAWKKSKVQPFEAWEVVKGWAKGVPTAWPHDGQQHKQQAGNRDAVQMKEMYAEAGWTMLDDWAQWPDGGNGVDAGLVMINKLMSLGKWKIFDDLVELHEEVREYHTVTGDNGLTKIVKIKEDLISAMRYAFMMARFAERVDYVKNPVIADEHYDYMPENACGY